MRARCAWILSALLAFGPAAAASAQVRSPVPLPTELQTLRRGLERAWFQQLPIDAGQERVAKIVHTKGILLALTDMARVIAIDPETGKVLWNVVVGTNIGSTPSFQVGTPGVNDTSVFITTVEQLFALNRATGEVRFTVAMPDLPATAAAADNNRAYISMATGRMYVINLGTRAVEWYIQTNGRLTNPVMTAGDRIAFASTDHLLYVTPPNERLTLLRYETDAPVTAPIAIYEHRIAILPSEDFTVYGVDLNTGDTLWEVPMGNPILRQPALVGDDVYVAPTEGGLWRVKARSGEVVWKAPRAAWFISASRDKIYAMDKYHRFLVLDAANGGVRASWDLHDFTVPILNQDTDRAYIATPQGLLVGLHEPQYVQPLQHKIPTAERPLVPRPAREASDFGSIEAAPEPESPTAPEPTDEAAPKKGARRRGGSGMPGMGSGMGGRGGRGRGGAGAP